MPGYDRLHEMIEDYRDRTILDFDARAASEARRLVAEKVRIGTMDLKIASICLVHKARLICFNLADFRKVPGPVVEDWSKRTTSPPKPMVGGGSDQDGLSPGGPRWRAGGWLRRR